MNIQSEVLISICCVTYNHEKYISQCLDGFLMQKTNFVFEILVHEDASTDNTANIIREYEQKYPQLFRCVCQTENQFYQQNTLINILFPMARGKYIALCEGDDYWIDPFKLQKQVDFLEANPDFVICFHNVLKSFEDTDQPNQYYHPLNLRYIWTVEDLCLSNFIPTCSVIFKNNLFPKYPDWFDSPGDWLLYFLNAKYGKIKYLDEIMGVFRIHDQSFWTGPAKKNPVPSWKLTIKMLENVNQYLNFEYNEILSKTINDFKKSVAIFDSVNTYSVSLIVCWRELSYIQLWAENISYFQNTEIIFIHQITDEKDKETLANFADQYNISLVQVETSNNSSFVKNFGLKIAKGEYIFFADSDISINRLPLKYIIELTNNGITGLESISFDLSISYIKSSTMCATKSVLEALGGWDEEYDDTDWTDIDLCYRAKLAGYPMVAIPEMSQWITRMNQ